MFTPQRLFGEAVLQPNTLSYEPFLERARVQREQDRDSSARLALGVYFVARLVEKLLVLTNDAELAEAFRWQLQAVRRHVGELPGDSPETAHLAGVVDAVPEQGPPPSSLWMSLTAYAYFLEHEGRLEEALEVLMLAARSQGTSTSPQEFAAYALSAGRLNRLLARWEAASACYNSAEEAGISVADHASALRARLGRGAVQRGLGNLPLAREVAESVVRDAAALNLADVQAMGYADLSAACSLQGQGKRLLQGFASPAGLTKTGKPGSQLEVVVGCCTGWQTISDLTDRAPAAFKRHPVSQERLQVHKFQCRVGTIQELGIRVDDNLERETGCVIRLDLEQADAHVA